MFKIDLFFNATLYFALNLDTTFNSRSIHKTYFDNCIGFKFNLLINCRVTFCIISCEMVEAPSIEISSCGLVLLSVLLVLVFKNKMFGCELVAGVYVIFFLHENKVYKQMQSVPAKCDE